MTDVLTLMLGVLLLASPITNPNKEKQEQHLLIISFKHLRKALNGTQQFKTKQSCVGNFWLGKNVFFSFRQKYLSVQDRQELAAKLNLTGR